MCIEPAILDAARTAYAREADADEGSDEDDAAHSPWVRRMRQIVRTADLDKTTVNVIREQLQEEMGQRVPKKDIREAVESFLSERQRKHRSGGTPSSAWHRQRSHDERWRCFLDEQKASGIARGAPCTAVWMAGAIAYRCRTCQTGEQSSVCVACFRASDHEGHDYIMYRSETGGVCDCGDLESWSARGCCDAHRPIDGRAANDGDSRNTKTFPEGIASDVSEAMLGVALERLLLSLESTARARGPHLPPAAGARREAEGKMAEKLLRWLLRVADCGAMRAACAAAMTRRWDGPTADFNLRACTNRRDNGDGGDDDGHPSVAVAVEPAWDNGGCPNARYVSGFGGLYGSVGATTTTDAVRAELRRRRLVVKTRTAADRRTTTTTTTRGRPPLATASAADGDRRRRSSGDQLGGDTPRGEWPLAGTRDAGLLECLLRATCLPSLPTELAELSTTLVLTLLFNPEFKVAFASALVRHYRDLVLFPNTLPWPGVSRMDRGGSAPIASGLSDNERIRGEMSDGPISAAVTAMNVDDSDTDSDADANDVDDDDDDDDDAGSSRRHSWRRDAAPPPGVAASTAAAPEPRRVSLPGAHPSRAARSCSGSASASPSAWIASPCSSSGPCPSSRTRCSARGCFASCTTSSPTR